VDYLIVCAASLVIALLTFFSGFGLGTLLLPVLAIFFPIDLAVAATAVVHLANNVYKAFLVGRHADRGVVARFGVPAVVAAFAGAGLLVILAGIAPLVEYTIGGRACEVTALKLVVAFLIVGFAMFDLVPRLRAFALDRRYLPLGGALSGFFGGLSGHQGALRSAFLTKLGFDARTFIATGVLIAVLVDVARLLVYGAHFARDLTGDDHQPRLWGLVAAATGAAFTGSFVGARLLHKVTVDALRTVIGILLVLLGAALATGLV
jgi:uncharacterized membrane protein YfcA